MSGAPKVTEMASKPPNYNDVSGDVRDLQNVQDGSVGKASKGGEPERALWGNKVEFFLTMVGYAVGLGNVWRFPYLCFRNGGGAFLIPYFGTLILVGLPLFFMEIAFGQFASLGPIAIWTVNPLFKGLGYSMVIINTIIGMYYNVIVSWTIYYFFASMTSRLPWSTCDNTWNTVYCFTAEQLRNLSGIDNITKVYNNETLLISRSEIKTPSEEYFYREVLQITDGIDNGGKIVWSLALCLMLAWLIVFFVLIKGISSLGKVVYFSSLFPYVILTIMLVRGLTLDGAMQGILYYIKPDFRKLQDGRAWSDAATQIFFSLSTCTGGVIAMASFNPFRNNCRRDSIIVPIINCMTSFYGGFAIFSVLGYMAKQKGVTVAEVAASGPGLVFVVFPEALSAMPVAPLWSILFFIMMMTLGFSSEFSIIECFFAAMIDEFPALRRTRLRTILFRITGCVCFFFVGLSMVTQGGFYVFDLLDFYVGGFPLLIVGFFECIAINIIYGYKNFAADIEMMIGRQPGIYFRATWCCLSPLILAVIVIFMSARYTPPEMFSQVYPEWAQAVGWIIVIICVVLIPAWFLVSLCMSAAWKSKEPGVRATLKAVALAMRPSEHWHPANPDNQIDRYAPKLPITSKVKVAVMSSELFPPSYSVIKEGLNKDSICYMPSENEKSIQDVCKTSQVVGKVNKSYTGDDIDCNTYKKAEEPVAMNTFKSLGVKDNNNNEGGVCGRDNPAFDLAESELDRRGEENNSKIVTHH